MKAKYIIQAIAALREAEHLNYSTPPQVFGRVLADLAAVRMDLQVYSRLGDVEIEIEEAA